MHACVLEVRGGGGGVDRSCPYLMLFLEVLQRLRTHVRSGCEQLITQRWIHLQVACSHMPQLSPAAPSLRLDCAQVDQRVMGAGWVETWARLAYTSPTRR